MGKYFGSTVLGVQGASGVLEGATTTVQNCQLGRSVGLSQLRDEEASSPETCTVERLEERERHRDREARGVTERGRQAGLRGSGRHSRAALGRIFGILLPHSRVASPPEPRFVCGKSAEGGFGRNLSEVDC